MLELEAGKYYRDRLGDIRGPLTESKETPNIFPFCDHNVQTYTPQGRYLSPFVEHSRDLVECISPPTLTQSTRAEVLSKATDAVTSRGLGYGTPEDNFAIIAKYWSIWKEIPFTPLDVAMMLSYVKDARIKATAPVGKYHEDSFVDRAGYSACAAEIVKNL